jgi:hypothetical protein
MDVIAMRTLLCLLTMLSLDAAPFMAGAAKKAVTPDLAKHAPVYMAGFANNRRATGVHDDLWARCLALSAGKSPVAICGVDSIGLFFDDVEKVRALVRRQFGKPVDVVVAALHDHQAPDTMGPWGPQAGVSGINETYNAFVIEKTASAALAALQELRPASARFARFSGNELDSFIDDGRPPVCHDSELVLMALDDLSGHRIATLVNWANHPEALGSKNTLITADYPAAFYTRLEELDGGVAILLNGAVGGMQSPLGATVNDPATSAPAPPDSFRFAEIIGRRVAEIATASLRKARPVPRIDSVDYFEQILSIPVSNRNFLLAAQAGLYRGRKPMSSNSQTSTPVGLLRLSRDRKPVLEAAMIPGELYPELSVGGIQRYPGADFPDAPLEPAIKQLMKAPYRMLVGLANDEIGYIIPRAEWDEMPPYLQNKDKPWYGEVNSIGPEAAPRIADALRALLARP